MKKVALGLSLAGAVMLLVGIFLPWIHYQSGSIGGFSVSYSLSGWGIFQNTSWFDDIVLSGLKLESTAHALIVFITSIVMLLCSVIALILPLRSKGENAGGAVFGIVISLTAVLAMGGLIWFLADMSSTDNWSDYIGAGVYVCGAGAVLGLVGGILAAVKGK